MKVTKPLEWSDGKVYTHVEIKLYIKGHSDIFFNRTEEFYLPVQQ